MRCQRCGLALAAAIHRAAAFCQWAEPHERMARNGPHVFRIRLAEVKQQSLILQHAADVNVDGPHCGEHRVIDGHRGSEPAVTNLKCNLERGDSGVKLRWVSYIRGIVVVDC